MIPVSPREKEDQRGTLRRLMARHSAGEKIVASRCLAERLVLLPEWRRARAVALYASLPGEPDTNLLFGRARAEGKRVFYPFSRVGDRTLGFAEVESLESLRPGALRFREPPPAGGGQKLQVDLLLVPGLGFDREGMRLGRGRGYYDRTLAEIGGGVIRAGLFFSWQELPQVAVEAHDQRMDLVVTEKEAIRFRAAA